MAKKKKTSDDTKEIRLTENDDYNDEFYDNTAGTIFSADSDAETGSNKQAKKTAAKQKKQSEKSKPSKNRKPLITVIVILAILGCLIGLFFLIKNVVPDSDTDSTKATYPTDENGEQYATDLKGNKIKSEKDGNGNIIVAGIEELINHVPADIKAIKVTNEYGTFEITAETPTEKSTDESGKEQIVTKETVYTLKGYENAPLETGMPDAVANDAAAVTTTNVVDITGANPSEYGLDKPSATAEVTFTNKNKRTITVGNQAPDNAGTYIMVDGDKAIYLVDNESVDAFLYKETSLLNKIVTPSSEADDGATPKKVKISGANFPKTIEIVPNDDETVSMAYYKMKTPTECFVNVANGSKVLESLRSVTANDVIAYKPDEKTLQKYKIDMENPYAELNADFSDISVHLYAAKPIAEKSDDSTENVSTMVYVYNPSSKMLYSLNANKVAWVTTSYEDLVFEYVIKPNLSAIKTLKVTAKGKTYAFDLSSETKKDEKGIETSKTVVKSDGKTIDTGRFDVFFQNLESATLNKVKSGTVSGEAELTVKVIYNTDKESDSITFYKGDTGKYNCSFDASAIIGDVFDTYVNKIIEDVPKIAKGEEITAI